MFEADQTIEAREAAIEANRLSPDLIPAAVMAAQSYIEQGNKKYATRVIKKAWEAMPHPDLAATFAAIEPEEDAAARMKRFQTLTKLHRDHAETRMLLAELHIANEDFPQARRDLGDLFETDPTARVATLLAAIERGEGAPDNVVKGWLTRALTVPRGPQWVCENCLHIHANWQPVCENCESFDTLAWIKPPMAEVAMPGSIGMLPMIVGNPEPQPAPDLSMIEDAELLDPDAPDDPTENQRT